MEPWHYHLRDLAGYLPSENLSFLTWKMGITMRLRIMANIYEVLIICQTLSYALRIYKSPSTKATWLGGGLALKPPQDAASPECQVPGRL